MERRAASAGSDSRRNRLGATPPRGDRQAGRRRPARTEEPRAHAATPRPAQSTGEPTRRITGRPARQQPWRPNFWMRETARRASGRTRCRWLAAFSETVVRRRARRAGTTRTIALRNAPPPPTVAGRRGGSVASRSRTRSGAGRRAAVLPGPVTWCWPPVSGSPGCRWCATSPAPARRWWSARTGRRRRSWPRSR